MANKSAHEIRLGYVKAIIWQNQTQNGPRYNVMFSRLYKEGNEWRTTDSFGRDDLLLLAKVAHWAHTWIFSQTQDGVVNGPPFGTASRT